MGNGAPKYVTQLFDYGPSITSKIMQQISYGSVTNAFSRLCVPNLEQMVTILSKHLDLPLSIMSTLGLRAGLFVIYKSKSGEFASGSVATLTMSFYSDDILRLVHLR
uniref:Uncharacterized protein n=1 Tax=Rhizophagus irregularis (strain DAOM 181602 / DAOM 197198 / MUCL 43194) TaxID=747089 RepID=U9UG60_RHIID